MKLRWKSNMVLNLFLIATFLCVTQVTKAEEKLFDYSANGQGDATILGITIGKQLRFPKCSGKRDKKDIDCINATYSSPFLPQGTKGYELRTTLPDYLISVQAISVINGVVQDIYIVTKGSSHSKVVMEALREKYGEPHKLDDRHIEDFSLSTKAIWNFTNLTVEFNTYNGRNNGNGYIRLTQRGLADSQNESTPIEQRKL